MSVLEIDKREVKKLVLKSSPANWQQRFRKNIYHNNYAKYFRKEPNEDMMLEESKNRAACSIVALVNESKKPASLFQNSKEFYDPQTVEVFYSPYSVTIPLQSESYLNDELINTFALLSNMKDQGKNCELISHCQDIYDYFINAKREGPKYIQEQWVKIKKKYICGIDSIKAVSILIQLMRNNSAALHQLYLTHGQPCDKQVFRLKVNRAAMYIRSSLKTHQNLKMSVDVKDQVNLKTLPMIMKTWYCALCMHYDCEKHKLDPKVYDHQYHYISIKNKKTEAENIQNAIKLLKFYEDLKKDGSMEELTQKEDAKPCSQQCYLKLSKKDIPRLYGGKFKMISPLAKSLLQMGVHMFSYNPCQIHQIFQSKFGSNRINCNQIFIHFTEECDLPETINRKMEKSEMEYLQNENSKLINVNIRIPTNQGKVKRTAYQEKRATNKNPEFATCMHNFIGESPIDHKCEKCVCRERGFCLPSCLCTENCEIMRVGCTCRGLDSCQAEKCICFINKMQCQPGLCGQCFAGRHQKRNSCKNDQILRQSFKKLNIGVSKIPQAGLGAFAGENYARHDLVCIYSGQHISSQIDFIREALIKDLSFYNFDSPNGKHITASIDARFMGNKSRFINHANDPDQNLRADTILSNGTQYIAIIANKQVAQGEELFFNYDGSGQLYLHHRHKYPFIKPPSKKN